MKKNPRIQVKADGFRTRTFSHSGMGFDNAISYACYLIECEDASNVRIEETMPNGYLNVFKGNDYILSMM